MTRPPYAEENMMLSCVDTIRERDRQTDRQTDGQTNIAIGVLSGENRMSLRSIILTHYQRVTDR